MILTEPKIIVPNQRLAQVYRQTNLGVHAYDEDDLCTPDSSLWRSKVLDLRLYEYPPNLTYVFDRSRYNNHGTITGAVWTPQGRNFDGSDDFINCGDKDVFSFTDGAGTDKPFSFVVWFNLDILTSGRMFLGKWVGTGNLREWMAGFQGGVLSFELGNFDGYVNRIGRKYSVAPSTGVWYCAAGTYDGSEAEAGIKLYLNGARVDDTTSSNGTYTGMSNTTGVLSVGGLGETGYEMDGLIGDVLLYDNRVLTPLEIQNIYLATKWRY